MILCNVYRSAVTSAAPTFVVSLLPVKSTQTGPLIFLKDNNTFCKDPLLSTNIFSKAYGVWIRIE